MTIRCPECKNVVATIRQSGSIESRRKGRMIVCRYLEEIQCEECGHIWKPQTEVVIVGDVVERVK